MRSPRPIPGAGGSRRGFTMIEVLAALLIFSVAIVGIIEGMGTALAYQGDLVMRQRAAMLASNVLEEIKYQGDLTEGQDAGQFDGDDAVFTWQTDIETTDVQGLMMVTSTVAWGPQGNMKDYSITTMIYDQGASEEDQDQQNKEDTGGAGGQDQNQNQGMRF